MEGKPDLLQGKRGHSETGIWSCHGRVQVSLAGILQTWDLWEAPSCTPGMEELCFSRHKATLPFLSFSLLFSTWLLCIGPFYYSNLNWRDFTICTHFILFFFLLLSKKKKNTMTSSAIQLVRFWTRVLQWFTLTAVIFFIGGNWKFRDTEWPLQAERNKSLSFQLPLLMAKLLSLPQFTENYSICVKCLFQNTTIVSQVPAKLSERSNCSYLRCSSTDPKSATRFTSWLVMGRLHNRVAPGSLLQRRRDTTASLLYTALYQLPFKAVISVIAPGKLSGFSGDWQCPWHLLSTYMEPKPKFLKSLHG